MALRYIANSNSPSGFHKQLILYGGGFAIQVASRPAASCVQSTTANVLYGELLFPSEVSSAWTDTSGVVSGYSSTNISWNSPTVLLTTRTYPTCASDVHSIVNHPSAPTQWALGGWDVTNNVLNTYDRINGSAFAQFTVVPAFQGATPGRAASGAAGVGRGCGGCGGGWTDGRGVGCRTEVSLRVVDEGQAVAEVRPAAELWHAQRVRGEHGGYVGGVEDGRAVLRVVQHVHLGVSGEEVGDCLGLQQRRLSAQWTRGGGGGVVGQLMQLFRRHVVQPL